eukprot:jgi/Bigna1/81067/fgenesh1_pg.77_\
MTYNLEWVVSDTLKATIALGQLGFSITQLYTGASHKTLDVVRYGNIVASVFLLATMLLAHEPVFINWQAYLISNTLFMTTCLNLFLFLTVIITDSLYTASRFKEHRLPHFSKAILAVIVGADLLMATSTIVALANDSLAFSALRILSISIGSLFAGVLYLYSLLKLKALLEGSRAALNLDATTSHRRGGKNTNTNDDEDDGHAHTMKLGNNYEYARSESPVYSTDTTQGGFASAGVLNVMNHQTNANFSSCNVANGGGGETKEPETKCRISPSVCQPQSHNHKHHQQAQKEVAELHLPTVGQQLDRESRFLARLRSIIRIGVLVIFIAFALPLWHSVTQFMSSMELSYSERLQEENDNYSVLEDATLYFFLVCLGYLQFYLWSGSKK